MLDPAADRRLPADRIIAPVDRLAAANAELRTVCGFALGFVEQHPSQLEGSRHALIARLRAAIAEPRDEERAEVASAVDALMERLQQAEADIREQGRQQRETWAREARLSAEVTTLKTLLAAVKDCCYEANEYGAMCDAHVALCATLRSASSIIMEP